MSLQEGDTERLGFYKPITVLLEGVQSRLKIAFLDTLGLQIPGNRIRHLNPVQLAPIEHKISTQGYEPWYPEHLEIEDYKPVDSYSRGFLSGIDVITGTVELLVGTSEGLKISQAVLIQYTRNPREIMNNEGNPEVDPINNPVIDNDGVVNVVILANGDIHACAILPNGEPFVTSFSHPTSRKSEFDYPENEADAIAKIKEASLPKQPIDARFMPLILNMGFLTAAASDICLDRTRDNSQAMLELLQFKGVKNVYEINRNGMDPRLAKILGVDPKKHPLEGLLDPNLIPEQSHVIELENYTDLLSLMIQGGFKFPTFFRSHELGIYFSTNSPFDDQAAANGILELLGYNEIIGVETGIIIPGQWPEIYKDPWNSRLAFIKHQLALQAYEALPGWILQSYLGVCSEIEERTVSMRNFSSMNTEIPEKILLDKETPPAELAKIPYLFKYYSARQQHRIAGGFMAGAIAFNKPKFPYWSGPPLHGDGSDRLDWAPESVVELLDDHGIWVSRAPAARIYPLGVSGILKSGEVERAARPFANPDIRVTEDGGFEIVEPDYSNLLVITEPKRPPIEHLVRDIEEVYGIRITFPTSLPEGETRITDLIPLEENYFRPAILNIAHELEKYPVEYLQGLKLNEMRITDNQSIVDPNPKNPNSSIRWFVDQQGRIVYFGFRGKPEDVQVWRIRSQETIHHAIRLLADKAFGIVNDEEWAALNTSLYTGLSYWESQQSYKRLTRTPDGFICLRARANEGEDRAFLADALFSSLPVTLLHDINQNIRKNGKDEPLIAKIKALLQIYEEESGGIMFPGWGEKFPYNYGDLVKQHVRYTQLLSYGHYLNPKAYAKFLENLRPGEDEAA